MRNGYDQFFKSARQSKAPSPRRPHVTAQQLEDQLRRNAGVKKAKRRRKSFPWGLTIASIVGVALTSWALFNAEAVEKYAKNVEIAWIGSASAETAAPAKAAPAAEEKKSEQSAEALRDAQGDVAGAGEAGGLDHLSKLNDRKKELDAREQEIARQEGELAKMKDDLEKRMRELEDMRAKISEMLAARVKTDDSKIETLVQMYSNMKPPQAAKVFESMDEDLAVEILGRMKKKSAADIMNLLKAEKAQVFSEKYAGYKRLPASSK